jgi:hypothetical protein
MQKNIFITIITIILIGAFVVAGFAIFYKTKYDELDRALKAASGTELALRLADTESQLREANRALTESRESVGRLEEVDKRRADGLVRISGILTDTVSQIEKAKDGNEKAKLAFQFILTISDEIQTK